MLDQNMQPPCPRTLPKSVNLDADDLPPGVGVHWSGMFHICVYEFRNFKTFCITSDGLYLQTSSQRCEQVHKQAAVAIRILLRHPSLKVYGEIS